MLANAPPISFIPARDLAAARGFYGSTLGLPVTDENPFAVVLDANGAMLRLTPVPGLEPQPHCRVGGSRHRGHGRYPGLHWHPPSFTSTV
jgi:catechol 2,3-dioxygenase-like lactoylglutathione lyase family enzyme